MTLKNHPFVITACVLAAGLTLAQDPAAAARPAGLPPGQLAQRLPAAAVAVPGADAAPVQEGVPALGDAAPGGILPPPRAPGARPALAPPARAGNVAAPGLGVPSSRPGLTGGQTPDDSESPSAKANSSGKTNTLKFSEAPLEIVLGTFSSLTKKTPIIAPNVPKVTITLKSNDDVELTREEMIWAIEKRLSLDGITIEPIDDKFVMVLAKNTARAEGIVFSETLPENPHPETGRTISQMIILQHITAAEAQKALEGFKRPDGLLQVFERTNSILVTDTQENVNRMIQIVKFIDLPTLLEEKVEIRVIKYAKAEDIKKRLEEFVAESQKQGQPKEEIRMNQSGAPGTQRVTPPAAPVRPTPPGLARPPAAPVPAAPLETINASMDEAERGIIKGKVHIMADERSNQLIITTRPGNMKFFDQIIDVLDIETSPDIGVHVERLKYADAEEVATKLNDLIGNSSSAQQRTTGANPAAPGTRTQNTPPGTPPGAPTTDRGSLTDIIAARRDAAAAAANAAAGPVGETKLGQLSKDNIKILSDKRTNAIIMMASKSDLASLNKIIEKMDIQLSQVMIETVVVQVELGSGINTGIDWVLGRDARGEDYVKGIYTLGGRDEAKVAGGGGSGNSLLGNLTGIVTGGSTGTGTNQVATVASHVLNQGINYFLKSDKLNVSALIQAAKNDSRAKLLSSPILLTVDNKEASIEATTMRYLYKGVRYSGGGYNSYGGGYEVPDFEQRDIGLIVKITPRINPNGTVVLTIDEKFETVGPDQDVGGQKYPTVNTRKLQADISVENMQTVVLGGLVQSESTKSDAGIPILKDIPWVGRWLFGSVKDTENRSELLVFITPYVFEDSASAVAEAHRRRSILSDPRPWDDGGWSLSPVADPVPTKTRLERQAREWADADEDYKAERELQKANENRAKQMLERTKKEAREMEKKRKNAQSEDTSAITVRAGGSGVQVFLPEVEGGD